MKAFTAILFFCLILLPSCRKKNTYPNEEMKQIIGTWNWVESAGGIGFMIITPASSGRTEEIEFTDRQIFRYTVNGKKEETWLFNVEPYENSTPLMENRLRLRKRVSRTEVSSTFQLNGISFRSSDTLILSDGAADGFTAVFVRK